MTTPFEVAVQAVLSPLAPGGAWFEENSTQPWALDVDGTVLPFIVWDIVVGTDINSLGGAAGLAQIRVQVGLYAPRALQTIALRKAVDDAFKASTLTVVPLSWQPFNEQEVGLRRIARDYSIWYDESKT